jgi:O-antigen/teichoic acid export membrane protein
LNRADVAKGFFWNFLFGLPNRLIFPILGIIIARILGPDEMGTYAVLTTVLSITDVIREAGLGHTFIADHDDSPRHEGHYAWFAITSAGVIALVVFLLRYQIADFFSKPDLAWGLAFVAFSILVNGALTIPVARLQRDQRFRDSGWAQTASAGLSYAVALPLVFSGFGFRALVWQLLARSILYAVFVLRMTPLRVTRPGREFLKKIGGKAVSVLSQNLMYSFYTIVDNAFVGKMFGPVGLGYYAVAWSLAIKPVEFVSFPLGGALFVAYTKHSHDMRRFASIFCRSLSAAALVTIPIFAFIYFFPKELMLVLYTPKFAESIPMLGYLAVYFTCRSLGTLAGSALVASGRAYLSVMSWCVGYAVAITGLLLHWGQLRLGTQAGVPGLEVVTHWGGLDLIGTIAWIAAGGSVAYSLLVVCAMAVLRPTLGDLRHVMRAVLVGLSSSAVCLALKLLPVSEGWRLLAGVGGLLLVHLVFVGVVYGRSPWAAFTPAGARKIWQTL